MNIPYFRSIALWAFLLIRILFRKTVQAAFPIAEVIADAILLALSPQPLA